MIVDDQLRALAEQAAARYPDSIIAASGWTRTELVDAIHARLRTKYTTMRYSGQLVAGPDGTIRHAGPDECPTPEKQVFESKAAAKRGYRASRISGKTRLWPYECPTGQHWHLTSQSPERQRDIAERIARKAHR